MCGGDDNLFGISVEFIKTVVNKEWKGIFGRKLSASCLMVTKLQQVHSNDLHHLFDLNAVIEDDISPIFTNAVDLNFSFEDRKTEYDCSSMYAYLIKNTLETQMELTSS